MNAEEIRAVEETAAAQTVLIEKLTGDLKLAVDQIQALTAESQSVKIRLADMETCVVSLETDVTDNYVKKDVFETLKTGLASLETDVTDNCVKKDVFEIVKTGLASLETDVTDNCVKKDALADYVNIDALEIVKTGLASLETDVTDNCVKKDVFETLKTGLESLETDVTDNYVKKDAFEIVKGQLDAVKAGVGKGIQTLDKKLNGFKTQVNNLGKQSGEVKKMVSVLSADLEQCVSQVGAYGRGCIEQKSFLNTVRCNVEKCQVDIEASRQAFYQHVPTLFKGVHCFQEYFSKITMDTKFRQDIEDAVSCQKRSVLDLIKCLMDADKLRELNLTEAVAKEEEVKISDLGVFDKELGETGSAAGKKTYDFHEAMEALSAVFSAVVIEDSTVIIASAVAGLAASTSPKPVAPVLSGGSAAFTPVPCVPVSPGTPPGIAPSPSAAAAATSVLESTALSSTLTTGTTLPSVVGSASEVAVVAVVAAGVSGDVRPEVPGTASVFELLAGDPSHAVLQVTFVEACTQVHQEVFGKKPSFNYGTDPNFIDALKSVTFSGLAFDEDRFDIVSSGMIDADRGVVDGSCIPPGKSIDELKKIFPVRRSFVGMKNDESKQRLFKLFMEQFMKSGHPVITDIWKVFKVVADF
jgi:predicted transport protein